MPTPTSDPIQLTAAPGADEHFVTKASAFRGMLKALKDAGHFDAVRARVPEHVQKFMDSPPLGISWMPALVFQYVLVNLHAVAGLDAVRSVGEKSVLNGPMKTMQPVIESMLRLFGAEPSAFIKRLPATMEGQLHGVEFVVHETAEREMDVTVTYSYLRNPPIECFVYWQGVFELTWKICGVHGEAKAPVLLDTPSRNSAQIEVSWTK